MIVRTMFIALVLALPGVAMADENTNSPLGLEVRGDDGTVLSRVEAVERDADGRIVAIEAPGLAPDDAPAASDMVAQNDAQHFFTSYSSAERNDRERSAGGASTRTR